MRKHFAWLCLVLILAGCGGSGGGGATAGGSSGTAGSGSTLSGDSGTSPTSGIAPSSGSLPLATPTPTVTAPSPGATSTPTGTSARVMFAVAVHSEDPHHPETPDFLQDKASYQAFRTGLLNFAAAMQARNLPWNFQSDYNFLQAAITYEVEQQDPALLATTDGLNIIAYLHDRLGVEIDPHSHENDGYNYADIAYLVTLTGVEPSGVVGGHMYNPADATYQNWPRFLSPLPGQRYPAYSWKASILMGAGSPGHRDPLATGIWHPKSETEYFVDSPSQTLTCFGGWDHDINHLPELAGWVSAGLLDSSRAWTGILVLNHSSLAQSGYLESTVLPQLDTLQALQSQGTIQVLEFENAISIFNTQYARQGAVFPSGDEFASFSLNIQDFAYVDRSAALLNRALDLHEELKVPVDVFLTTTQVDLFASQYPQLIERLKTSPVVSPAYHVRAPKPYANNYDWLGLAAMTLDAQMSMIRNYETHGLDLTSGQPTSLTGGFQKLTDLLGRPGVIVGDGDPTLAAAVDGVFGELGAQMSVEHAGTVNLGESSNGLWLRPEHTDLRLFEDAYAGQDGATILNGAFTSARAANGAQAPYFVGVKMHDNDFFATASAWVTVYQTGGRRNPPWDTSLTAPLLSDSEAEAMWQRYEATVRAAAAMRPGRNLVFGPMLVRLAENAGATNSGAGGGLGTGGGALPLPSPSPGTGLPTTPTGQPKPPGGSLPG